MTYRKWNGRTVKAIHDAKDSASHRLASKINNLEALHSLHALFWPMLGN